MSDLRTNKKHFVIINNNGVISATTPKDWARANQHFFESYNFNTSESTPRTKTIGKHLVEKLGFNTVENNEIVFYYPYKNL